MFGILKKKLSNFGDKLKRNVKEKEYQLPKEEQGEEPNIKEVENKEILKKSREKTEDKIVSEEKDANSIKKDVETEDDKVLTEIRKELEEEDKKAKIHPKTEIPKEIPNKTIKPQSPLEREEVLEIKKETTNGPVQKEEGALSFIEEELEEEEDSESELLQETNREKNRDIVIKKADEDKRELKAHISKTGKLKGFIKRAIEISESDLESLLWELELSLIESDVEQDTAHDLAQGIRNKLVGKKVSVKTIDEELNNAIKEILTEMMTTQKINLLEEIKKSEKPYKILMLGPNGAGKTTHIAKLTNYFKKEGFSVVLAAADTFRSGAIDQLQEHADRLGVKVIKQQYGADPAAVAFDAVKSAKANNFDIVIIDTAGRQETNKNLMEELKKIERIVAPNIKIFVGEAYVGQGLLQQATEFNDALGIDGFILSKIDTDAKGGTSISLLHKLKKPILYVGTGQGYEDFEEFKPEFILNRII